MSCFAQANDDSQTIQDIVKSKYGTCYKTIGQAISSCQSYTCVFPDFSNLKIWRANSIREMRGDDCYVIYYSYLGNKIIGNFEDCKYSVEQRRALSNLYAALFSTQQAIDMASLESQIADINKAACKERINAKPKK